MNFKPNKWKVIVSIIAVIAWLILSSFIVMYCKMCQEFSCEINYYNYYLVNPGCHCDCGSLSAMLLTNLINILIPLALTYIIWSLFEKPKLNKKRKK